MSVGVCRHVMFIVMRKHMTKMCQHHHGFSVIRGSYRIHSVLLGALFRYLGNMIFMGMYNYADIHGYFLGFV